MRERERERELKTKLNLQRKREIRMKGIKNEWKIRNKRVKRNY